MRNRNQNWFSVDVIDNSTNTPLRVIPCWYDEYVFGNHQKTEVVGVPVEKVPWGWKDQQWRTPGFSPCRLYVGTDGKVHLESGSCGPAVRYPEAKGFVRQWNIHGVADIRFNGEQTNGYFTPFTREGLTGQLSPYTSGGPDSLIDANGIPFAGRITFHHVNNDHTSSLRIHSIGIWETPDGESTPVGVHTDASYFCLNEIYRRNGMLRLSRKSVGPTVRGVEVTEKWIQGQALEVEVWGGVGTLRQATREEVAAIGERITKRYITKCVHEFRDRMAELKYSGEDFDKIARAYHDFTNKHRDEWSDVLGEAFNSWLPPEEKEAGLTKSITQMTGEEFNAWKHDNPAAWIILRRAYGLG